MRLFLAISILFLSTLIGSASLSSAAPESDGTELPLPEQSPDRPTAKYVRDEIAAPKADEEDEEIEAAIPEPTAKELTRLETCTAALTALGVSFERIEPIRGEKGCGIALPISVKTLPGDIQFIPDAELRCEAALALARWTKETVLPAAKRLYPEAELKAIRNASTYVCRTRNSQAGTKISEHGLGNAIDVASFTFSNGKTLEVMPRNREANMEEAFQRAVRFGGCLYFTTVIGPYSDPWHSDHLHFDLAERHGGYRLCRLPEMHLEPEQE
jgi:hypothetical protein